jgi:hypothetical protein
MGLFDWVEIVGGNAELGIEPGEEFQTKCLYSAMERYQVTELGDLVGKGEYIPIPFHGDFQLYRLREHEPEEFVVRFTHGKMEWIKVLKDYPEQLRGYRGPR